MPTRKPSSAALSDVIRLAAFRVALGQEVSRARLAAAEPDVPRAEAEANLHADIARAAVFPSGFAAWLPHWHFKNRESGADHTFADLWPGQRDFADLMTDTARASREGDQRWIFALKAGKLGFTELECAWDGYVAWALRNGRVHLFSKEEDAAKEMLRYILYGLRNLDAAWGLRFVEKEGGREVPWGRTGSQALYFSVHRPGQERDYGDTRTVQAYATSKNPAIDKTAQHAHVDEWCHMEHPKDVWSSIGTTVAPDGTAHIVSRGNGENKDVQDQWAGAVAGQGKLRAFFADWTKRPGRDQGWLEAEAATLRTVAAISHFAPENPDDAFRGDDDSDFVAIEWWDHCFDRSLAVWLPDPSGSATQDGVKGRWLGNLNPGDNTPVVLGVDAGVAHDTFGVVVVSRHPQRPDDPAIRNCKLWRPEDFEDEQIDFATVQSWLRAISEGGCRLGHPQYAPWQGGGPCKRTRDQSWEPGSCPACEAIAAGREEALRPLNVVQIVYDPWQLEAMMQELRRDNVAWCYPMNQAKERAEADRTFYDMIVGRRLGHPGDVRLREHVGNAKSKTQRDDDSKLRMVKKAPHRRIDLAVAAGMAIARVQYLNL